MEFKRLNGHYSFLFDAIVAEFFGTMGYMLSLNISSSIDIIPLVLFCMIICTRKVSGAHLNPAISVGVFIERRNLIADIWYLITYLSA